MIMNNPDTRKTGRLPYFSRKRIQRVYYIGIAECNGSILCTTSCHKVIAVNDCNVGDAPVELVGDNDEESIKQRAVCRATKHRVHKQDQRMRLFAKKGPVQRLIWLFRRLRRKHLDDMSVSASSMLQARGDGAMGNFVVEKNGSRNVRKFVICLH
jgi:hypothetical protein